MSRLFSFTRPTPHIKAGWMRLGQSGVGLSWTCERPLFSERYGHRRPLFTVRGWRVFFLRPYRAALAATPEET